MSIALNIKFTKFQTDIAKKQLMQLTTVPYGLWVICYVGSHALLYIQRIYSVSASL